MENTSHGNNVHLSITFERGDLKDNEAFRDNEGSRNKGYGLGT